MSTPLRSKKRGSTVIWALMALLVLGLGGFGARNFGGSVRSIGSVGDREIDVNDYARALRREMQAASAQVGQSLSFEQAQTLGLDQQVQAQVLATAAILKFLVMYNQYLWPLIVVQDEAYRPVMVGLQYFFQLNTAWGEIMAYLSLITIPVLAFYLVLQRAFIASIASTGVKG